VIIMINILFVLFIFAFKQVSLCVAFERIAMSYGIFVEPLADDWFLFLESPSCELIMMTASVSIV
jgi:hypothetical protein